MPENASEAPAVCILYAEDEDNDFAFLKHAFDHSGARVELTRAWDGEQAKPLLQRRESNYHAVITDLRMPNCSGYELLEWLRDSGFAKNSPVFVLSTSTLSRDSELCSRLGAARYFTKPNSPKGYAQLAQEILAIVRASSR